MASGLPRRESTGPLRPAHPGDGAEMETFGFGLEDAKKLITNAIRSAWCDEPTKERLGKELAQIDND